MNSVWEDKLDLQRILTDARNVRQMIRAFDTACEEAGATDTGEAWEILNGIRDIMTAQLADGGAK